MDILLLGSLAYAASKLVDNNNSVSENSTETTIYSDNSVKENKKKYKKKTDKREKKIKKKK